MAVETTDVDHHDDVGVGVGECARRGVPGPRRADLHVTVTTPNDDDETITLDQFLAECDRSPRSRVRVVSASGVGPSERRDPFDLMGHVFSFCRDFVLTGFRSTGPKPARPAGWSP